MSKKLKIGLFGYGVVGTGLYDVLHKSKTVDATIKKIVVKHKDKPRNISPEHFHFDKNEILNDDEINVVVELIDDADAAYEIVTTALKKGKAVVSANKNANVVFPTPGGPHKIMEGIILASMALRKAPFLPNHFSSLKCVCNEDNLRVFFEVKENKKQNLYAAKYIADNNWTTPI